MPLDISDTLTAKSDQLNADDLVGGPITVRVMAVSRGNADQPVTVKIDGGHKPWMPCKTTRRILAAAWGTDAEAWVGRTVRLFRDPSVKWAGDAIGGIRISGLSHISSGMTIKLAETKGGKKIEHRVEKLEAVADRAPTPPNIPAFLAKCAETVGGTAADAENMGHFLTAQEIDYATMSRAQLQEIVKRLAEGGDLRAKFEAGPEVQS